MQMRLPLVDRDTSELQASGSKCKNTSPSKPPTAKLSIIFSVFDLAAENKNERRIKICILFTQCMNNCGL